MTRRRIIPSTPEPRADIEAQVRAMRDPANPKDTVFLARGNEDAIPALRPAPGERLVRRPEGAVLTSSERNAERFRRGVDDAGMAKMLGYPAPKEAAARDTGGSVIQARDASGAVTAEAGTTRKKRGETIAAMARQAPAGGVVVETSADAAQARRSTLRAREGA